MTAITTVYCGLDAIPLRTLVFLWLDWYKPGMIQGTRSNDNTVLKHAEAWHKRFNSNYAPQCGLHDMYRDADGFRYHNNKRVPNSNLTSAQIE